MALSRIRQPHSLVWANSIVQGSKQDSTRLLTTSLVLTGFTYSANCLNDAALQSCSFRGLTETMKKTLLLVFLHGFRVCPVSTLPAIPIADRQAGR